MIVNADDGKYHSAKYNQNAGMLPLWNVKNNVQIRLFIEIPSFNRFLRNSFIIHIISRLISFRIYLNSHVIQNSYLVFYLYSDYIHIYS